MISFKTIIGKLRWVAIFEGISSLLLFFVATPLKYFGGYEHATKEIGMIHGVLFVLYIFMVTLVAWKYKMSFKNLVLSYVASIPPFGTFIADKKIFEPLDNKKQ